MTEESVNHKAEAEDNVVERPECAWPDKAGAVGKHGYIRIKGARANNLKDISLDIPRHTLTVVTGLSGSGKSSLAFDTIFAEGQRRYMESLSSYARQFLGQMEKPDVDYIEGLSPAISIDQKGASHNPRSTVGTVTEIYDYLRLLFARIGVPHCPHCGREIHPQTVDQITDSLLAYPEGTKLNLMAPLVRGKKGQFQKLFKEIADKGFSRVRVDGTIYRLGEEDIDLGRYNQHDIDILVDRVVVRSSARGRISESLETALELADGLVRVSLAGASSSAAGEEAPAERLFSQHLACAECGLSFQELAPRMFSFNTPYGACPECTGLGEVLELDEALIVPNHALSMSQGAIAPWGKPVMSFAHHVAEAWFWRRFAPFAEEAGIDYNTAWRDMSDWQRQLVLYGSQANEYGQRCSCEYEGVIPNLQRRFRETESEWAREEITKYMTSRTCSQCRGARLKPEARAVTVHGLSLPELVALPVEKAAAWLKSLRFSEREILIARQVLKELHARLGFLNDVGLDYLTLDRGAGSLSGGESQRIRLATQIGSGLTGVLYILDEPSIGLHQRDNARLLKTLGSLRDLGNTLIVVEHDEDTIRSADHVVDVGPGAGVHGGEIVAQGTPEQIAASPVSLTGAYLRGDKFVPVPVHRRQPQEGKYIEIRGCRAHNLKGIDVRFPLGVMTAVTGVSGSGKSTLVNEILCKGLAYELRLDSSSPGNYDSIAGAELINKVIVIDQAPIGRTPRSNPATYTGLFDAIRQLFAQTPDAKMRGFTPGRFSFNIKGGRCEACQGQGILKIEMHFLPDVFVPCEVCHGSRYSRETLEVRFKGKNIAEVLDMTVEEALELFVNFPKLRNKLQTLYDVGLGYIKLGQPATTLSGGEAQRVKLATELSRRSTGRTLYLLDEPTTGLHFDDVAHLLNTLQRLTDGGNTMVIIEHNLDVIKSADWIIDLGPEGGDRGGTVVACGTPEDVARHPSSHTAPWLRRCLHIKD